MIGWHQYVGNAPKRNFYTDDFNVIAFSKGNRGWAAFNNGPRPRRSPCRPGWPGGTYATWRTTSREGLLHSSHRAPNGFATVTVPALEAVAFDRTDRR